MSNLMHAHHELFKRSPDEQFDSMESLFTHCEIERNNSRDIWRAPQDVRPRVQGESLILGAGSDGDLFLNDWSFSQLCRLALVSKETVNRVAPDTASRILIDTLPTGTKPTDGRLKGLEFKRVRERLAATVTPPSASPPEPATPSAQLQTAEPSRNLPLAASENAKARELATLDEKFVTDVAHMPPAAAIYVRRHPCLSLALMQKWRVGVLPPDGGGDKRAWSLRGQLLYPILSEDGQLLAWVSRDPQFEMKEQAFDQLPPEQRTKDKRPAKHRFPVDFHRGVELFGQQSSRLREPGYREAISRCGIIVVEGFNDVIGLDALGIPAVGIMSNKITAGQVAKVERWANALAAGKVTVLFDADDAGDEGAKEAAWQFLQRDLNVRLGWSQAMHGGVFKGRQPESLTAEDWALSLVDRRTDR